MHKANKWQYILMELGLVCILTMLIIGVIIAFNIDFNAIPESYVINISLDIFGLVITLILFHSSLCEWNRVDGALFFFSALVFVNGIELFTDIIAWTVQGIPELAYINRIDNFVFYFLAGVINILYWNYIHEIVEFDPELWNKLNIIANIITVFSLLAVVLNCFFGFYFTVDDMGVYKRNPDTFMISNIGPTIIVLMDIFLIIRGKAKVQKKASLLLYLLLPVIFIFIQDFTFGLSLLYTVTLCSILIVYANVQIARGRELSEKKAMILEQKKQIAEREVVLTEQRMKILLSQMKPHFIYNGMAAIRRLIIKKPDNAVAAMDHFIGYLRGSIDMLEQEGLIPVEQELKFVENYLELERVRFGEDLEYELCIKETNFFVPPISIKSIVENAVRHGIRKKIDGAGKVRIETGKTATDYFIEIKDNGVGFDINQVLSDDRSHIGMKNTKERYEKLVDGNMKVESKIGKGTTVRINIPFRGDIK